MSEEQERQLDAYLETRHAADDPDVTALAGTAERVKEGLVAEPPRPRDRALFVQGVAARRASRAPWVRFTVPALALTACLIILGWLGHTALPGEVLFPVRQALAEVGLATTPAQEVDRRIEKAEEWVDAAREATSARPRAALRYALAGITELGRARKLVADVEPAGVRSAQVERIDALEERAVALVTRLGGRLNLGPLPGTPSPEPSASDDHGGDDSSGSGSGDDSSGSGSGDDSSGTGSGDDSSGSGSGGDSSGSGSGGDSSGSGSGGDSSGSGSGDDSSGSG